MALTPTPSQVTPGFDVSRMTLGEALAFAVALERDARDRYLTLARSMRDYGESMASEFFWRMAHLEEEHRVTLEKKWMSVVAEGAARHSMPAVHSVEGPLSDEVAMGLTLRAALELSLAAEERAHDFFVQAQGRLSDPEVKGLFAELAEEEVEHRALLRKELDGLAAL